jgi:hypothetical protein
MEGINMKRHIVLLSSLIVTLLVCWGCEQNSTDITPTPPPTVATIEKQPAKTVTVAEPNLVKAEPKIKEPAPVEPNVQMTALPPAEPNVPKIPVAEPTPAKPAENNSVEPKPIASEKTIQAQLCDMCNDFLSKYVDQQGMVDYRAISRKKLELATLLDKFKTLDRNDYNSWSKDDKLAFWLNAYNLEFTKIILSNYPIEPTRVLLLFWPPNSIRHIKGIWDENKFIIMGEEFTLREIETRFFRGEFNDPRVFLAICYGSVSGSPLRNEAYRGDKLSAQLDDQVKKFIASGQAFKVDRENQIVYLSSIFSSSWYGNLFIANYGTDLKFKQQAPEVRAVLNFLTKFLSPQDVSYIETGNYTVEFMKYDWTLNERAGQ